MPNVPSSAVEDPALLVWFAPRSSDHHRKASASAQFVLT
jgi:hypothetical protein